MSKRMSNRDKIIETATELFHFFGYDATSIDMLIKTAEVSKSNLYYYFDGKEELGLEVMENVASFYKDLMSETLSKKDIHPLKRLASLYRKIIDRQHAMYQKSSRYQGSFFGNMALEQSVKNEKFRSAVKKHLEERKIPVNECVKECSELGIFYDHLEPELITDFVFFQFEGVMLVAKAYNSFVPIEELFRQIQKLLIKEEHRHLLEEFTQFP